MIISKRGLAVLAVGFLYLLASRMYDGFLFNEMTFVYLAGVYGISVMFYEIQESVSFQYALAASVVVASAVVTHRLYTFVSLGVPLADVAFVSVLTDRVIAPPVVAALVPPLARANVPAQYGLAFVPFATILVVGTFHVATRGLGFGFNFPFFAILFLGGCIAGLPLYVYLHLSGAQTASGQVSEVV